jgi:hypothetical protein
MADEDNFDIDIYGDEGGPDDYNGEQSGGNNYNYEEEASHSAANGQAAHNGNGNGTAQQIDTPTQSKMDVTPSQQEYSQPTQGVKRKTMDERPIDPSSTNAVQITELHWWFNEDDLRGWCDQAGCEEEIKEITFNEHKVNGKSKGYSYLQYHSPYAKVKQSSIRRVLLSSWSNSTEALHRPTRGNQGRPQASSSLILYWTTEPLQDSSKRQQSPQRGTWAWW